MKLFKKLFGGTAKMRLGKLENDLSLLQANVGKFIHLTPIEIQALAKRVDQIGAATGGAMKLNGQILTFLGDTETKFEAYKTLLIRNDVIESEEDFETVWDEIKGLRVREGHETIEAGRQFE